MKFFVFNFCEKMKLSEGIKVVSCFIVANFHKDQPNNALKVLYFQQKLLKVSLTNLRKFEVASFFFRLETKV